MSFRICLLSTLLVATGCCAQLEHTTGLDRLPAGQRSFLLDLDTVTFPDSTLSLGEQESAWKDIITKLNAMFGKYQKTIDSPNELAFLVHQFGHRGPVFDLKCLLMDPEVFLAQHYNEPASTLPETKKKSVQEQKKMLIALQRSVARVQTETFLKNPKTLDRYYNALIWSRQFFGTPKYHWVAFAQKVGGLNESFKKKDDSNYWWYARDTVLLLHATSRDDLLRNADPEEMQAVFQKWYVWLTGKLPYFEADENSPVWKASAEPRKTADPKPLKEPDVPFPEWKEKASLPAPSVIDQMKLALPVGGQREK